MNKLTASKYFYRGKVGEDCPVCMRPITADVLEEKIRKYKDKYPAAKRAEVQGGSIHVKHQRSFDYDKAIELYHSGMKMKDIAKAVGGKTENVRIVIRRKVLGK